MFFRWVGFRGFIAFCAGMFLMAYALLSKNPMLKWIISLTESEEYLWDILKGGKREEKEGYIEIDRKGNFRSENKGHDGTEREIRDRGTKEES